MAKQELMEAVVDNGLSTLQPYDKQIDELQNTCMALTVTSVDDKEGLKVVHEWRMKVKKLRVEVDKEGKRLREDAVKRQKLVLAEANRIIGRIEPIEEHLKQQEEIVEREKARIAAEKAAAVKAMVEFRFNELRKYGAAEMPAVLEALTEDEFQQKLSAVKAEWDRKTAEESERRRIQQEQAAELAKQRADQDRIRAEQEKQAAELRRQQEAIEAERRKIEEQKAAEARKQAEAEREKQRQAEMEQAKKDAAERAAKAERERIEREQREAKEQADCAERERLEEEAAKPYRAKLNALADAIIKLTIPEGKHKAEVQTIVETAASEIRKIARKR